MIQQTFVGAMVVVPAILLFIMLVLGSAAIIGEIGGRGFAVAVAVALAIMAASYIVGGWVV